MRTASPQTGTFQGVWQIFVYNWHFYAGALVVDFGAVLLLMRFSPQTGIRLLVGFLAGAATFWSVSSLVASHYIYDRSQLYSWNWLVPVVKDRAGTWANIHAGLDQTSDSLTRLFPSSRRRIVDIFVPSEMTEPSIGRARRRAPPSPASESATPSALPFEDRECDTVFLIFVAHELRSWETRLQFFREIHRALKPSGRVILIEHSRDSSNFLAYGPGALHFFSRRQWLAVSGQAGLDVTDEFTITPFVRCYVLTKPCGAGPHTSESPTCA